MRLLFVCLSLLLACGCAASRPERVAATPATLPPPSAPRPTEDGHASGGGICEVDPSACPRADEAEKLSGRAVVADVYSMQSESVSGPLKRTFNNALRAVPGTTGGATTSTPTATLPHAGVAAQAHEMLDIEARFAIECESVSASAAKLREAVRAVGGTITLDQSEQNERRAEATMEIRVPIRAYDGLAAGLDAIGTVRSREVKAKDIAKEHHDAELLLGNLEAAMKRYEELLARAAAVPEVLSIERELERLRARIDRVKGDLTWMKDRVARATVRVRLYPTAASEEVPLASRSALYPSLRGAMLFDLRGESDRFGYAGGGLGLAWHPESGTLRALGGELDIARSAFTDPAPGSRYAYLAVLSLDLYSDLLGGGRRRFFNPWLGLRGGYAQTGGSGDLALGGAVGVDIWKARNVVLGLAVRGLGLIGNDRGAHLIVGPELNFAFAF